MKEKDDEIEEIAPKNDHPEKDLKEPDFPPEMEKEEHKEKDLKEPPIIEPPIVNKNNYSQSIKKFLSYVFFVLKIIFSFYMIYIGINLLTNKEYNTQYQYKLKVSLVKFRKIIDEKFPGLLASPVIFNIIDYDILVLKAVEIIFIICGVLIGGGILNMMGIKFGKIILFIGVFLDIALTRNNVFIGKNKNVIEIVKAVSMILGIFL